MASDYLSKYKSRVSRNGDNVGETYVNNTISFIESTFADSVTFREVGVISHQYPDITLMDARVVTVDRMGTMRQVLFRPQTGLNLGSYLKFDNMTWLIIDQYGERTLPKYYAMVERCNSLIKWKDKNGNIISQSCIASQSPLGSKAFRGRDTISADRFDVNLATGQIYIFAEKNPTTELMFDNQRLVFGRNVYEVMGIDDVSFVDIDGYGLIQIMATLTTSRDGDDFVNQIAVNDWTTPTQNVENGQSQGGRIW